MLAIKISLLLFALVCFYFASKREAPVSSLNLSDEQKELLRLLENTSEHMFITGKAGSGKSTLLQEYRRVTKKRTVVVAPTGIAALNVNGQTIHSLFKFDTSIKLDRHKLNKKTRSLLSSIDVLIIDEISMVRADVIDAIDRRLRYSRNSKIAFGGVRLVMFGDLYQLPPIVGDSKLRQYLYNRYDNVYFFSAKVWSRKNVELDVYEIQQVFRQKDSAFKEILNEIREGKVSSKSLLALNSRTGYKPASNVITLASTNKQVHEINQTMLDSISGREYTYSSKSSNDLSQTKLKLKIGAQVMFTKNDAQSRWVNGSIGIIKSLSKRGIKVSLDGKVYSVNKVTWSETEYEYSPKGNYIKDKQVSSFSQYPLKLAYAVTIHKSQGQTFANCQIDLKHGVFASGQTYVALSRCKSLDGLYLSSPIMQSDINIDPAIVKFMSKAKRSLSR